MVNNQRIEKSELQKEYEKYCKQVETTMNTTTNEKIYEINKSHLNWLQGFYKKKYDLI